MNSYTLKIIDENCCKISIKSCKVAKTKTEETKKCKEKSRKLCEFKKSEKQGKYSCANWEAFIRKKLLKQRGKEQKIIRKKKKQIKKVLQNNQINYYWLFKNALLVQAFS